MPGRRNRRRWRDLRRRIRYSDKEEVSVSPETNSRATGFRWRAKPARKRKYVDDGIIACKINMQTGQETGELVNGKKVKQKHDLLTQNMFRRVVEKATSRGMVVNSKKTRLLCVSDALHYKACLLYTSPSPRDQRGSRMPSSA